MRLSDLPVLGGPLNAWEAQRKHRRGLRHGPLLDEPAGVGADPTTLLQRPREVEVEAEPLEAWAARILAQGAISGDLARHPKVGRPAQRSVR